MRYYLNNRVIGTSALLFGENEVSEVITGRQLVRYFRIEDAAAESTTGEILRRTASH